MKNGAATVRLFALAALTFGADLASASAASPPAYPLPSTWRFVRPDVVDATFYFSERWGIRFKLPKPNLWCGTAGAMDRGGTIVLNSGASCADDSNRDEIILSVRPRWNVSGVEDDLPPVREAIARAHCGARPRNDPTFRILPRVAGLPAFECSGDKAARGPHEGLFGITVILFRGDKSDGRPGKAPYPKVEYHLHITAPHERAAEARAIMSDLLRRVQLRPL